MSADIPQGWHVCRLEDCVEVLDSLRVPVNNDERQSRIEGKPTEQLFPYYGATGQVGFIDDFLFDEELVALGEDGVPFLDPLKSKAYMLRGKTWVNNHAHVLRSLEGVAINKFVFYYLNQFDYQGYVNGGTRLKLTQANMRMIPVPLPPLAEQTRIAQKLDELLAQVDTLKARIDGIPALLKRFRQSVLAATVSGRLTEEWRERTELRYQTHTNDYPATPLGLVADFQNGFAFKSEWFSNEGDIQVAKIGNVRNGKVDLANSPAFVSNETGFDYQRFMTIEGDLLLSMTGTKYKRDYGYACAAPAGLLVNQRVGKLRPLEGKMESGFLLLCLQSGDFREQFFSGETGQVSQGNVGSEHIKKCLIPTPTIEEQIEITRRVEQLFAFADQLEAKVASAKNRIDHLTQSILAKAFRGELVPQDSNDEPASVLLKRIKAQRAAAPKAKRGRKASA